MNLTHEILLSTQTRPRRRWVMPASFLWAMGVLLWLLDGGLSPQSNQVQVIMLATLLTILGLISAAVMSGDLDVRTALARLKLGPWMGVGFL